VVWGTLASADLCARGTGRAAPDQGNLCRVAGTPASRTVLAAGLTFLAAAIGITTLWFALNTRSWDELEAVLVPPLIVGAALAAVWACVLGVGLLVQWTWARWWALLTFVVVSAFSGLALLDTVRRVVDGDTTPVRHVAAPAGLLVVAVSIVLLLTREVDRS
jgi:DMSO reductase anchor subunit